MGLSISVGTLADLRKHDPEGAEWLTEELEAVSALMKKSGLPPHKEPENVSMWSADGYGYSGLHHLREVAGLVWMGKPIPKGPLAKGYPAESALFQAALHQLNPSKIRRFFSGRKAKLPFVHLVVHSDAEGYYFPTDFETPFAPLTMEESLAHIWPLGSVQRLSKEIEALAEVLEIPKGMKSDDTRLLDRVEEGNVHSKAEALWEFQPTAAYTALILKEACAASLETGAAICFH